MSNYPPPPPPPPGDGQLPPPPAQPGGYGQPPVPAGGNQKALWAMITGILALLCCGPVGIASIILGISAKKEIDASGGAQTGGGMALAGIVLGVLAILWMVIATILFLTGAMTFNLDAGTTSSGL